MITFCLGFRNWHLDHLNRCVESLVPFNLPIVAVDCSPEPAKIARARHLLIVREPTEEWSRSYALNQAAREVKQHGPTPWLCFTDADMIFPSHWLKSAIAATAIKWKGDPPIRLTHSRDLPEDFDFSAYYDDETLRRASTPHPSVGMGAAMLVPRHWFERVGGFDEFYKVWGCEDNDLVWRAAWDGLEIDWLPNTFVAHQWHRRDWPTPMQYDQVTRNREYYCQRVAERGPIVRNR